MKTNKNCNTVPFDWMKPAVHIPPRKIISKEIPSIINSIVLYGTLLLFVGCGWGQYKAFSDVNPRSYRGFTVGQVVSVTEAIELQRKYWANTPEGRLPLLKENSSVHDVYMLSRHQLAYSKIASDSGYRKYPKVVADEIDRRFKNAS